MKLIFHPLDMEPLVFTITQSPFLVGRSSSCEVPLVVEGISRQHCKIENRDGEVFITDLGSTNGVYIDGKRIQPNIPTRYQTFFPLGIGSIPLVTIEMPDLSRIGANDLIIKAEQLGQPRHSDSHGLTRTKVMTPRQPRVPPPQPKEKAGSSKLINVLAILVILGGAWFFFQTHESRPDEAAQSTPKTPPNEGKAFSDNGHF